MIWSDLIGLDLQPWYKKLQHAAEQRSLQYRGEYVDEIQIYHRDCFVFIDETGCNSKDHTHRFGHAMRGESAVDHRWLHRDTRISAIVAMSTSGILAVEMMSGSVNGDKFFDYVRGSFIPEMLLFEGENPDLIAVHSRTQACQYWGEERQLEDCLIKTYLFDSRFINLCHDVLALLTRIDDHYPYRVLHHDHLMLITTSNIVIIFT